MAATTLATPALSPLTTISSYIMAKQNKMMVIPSLIKHGGLSNQLQQEHLSEGRTLATL
jgi:hypothetical protein